MQKRRPAAAPSVGHGDPDFKLLPSSSKDTNHTNKEIREYLKPAPVGTGAQEAWTTKSGVPSSKEILAIDDIGEELDLMANKISGSWESRQMYLKTHYELLREDAVAPLRDAVAYVRNDPQMKDDQNICIYEKVRQWAAFESSGSSSDAN
jgi:helicase required for RNAi-mediated heterochromatin assembly 1